MRGGRLDMTTARLVTTQMVVNRPQTGEILDVIPAMPGAFFINVDLMYHKWPFC